MVVKLSSVVTNTALLVSIVEGSISMEEYGK